jgi:hypothetical protein
MGVLSDDLRGMGYDPAGKESPFDENGSLWTKGYELVCDETGIVIRNDGDNPFRHKRAGGTGMGHEQDEKVYRYQNSNKVKLIGGYISSYQWGTDEEENFLY